MDHFRLVDQSLTRIEGTSVYWPFPVRVDYFRFARNPTRGCRTSHKRTWLAPPSDLCAIEFNETGHQVSNVLRQRFHRSEGKRATGVT
jgi:hypothetical protein